jgi:hypothetical protein
MDLDPKPVDAPPRPVFSGPSLLSSPFFFFPSPPPLPSLLPVAGEGPDGVSNPAGQLLLGIREPSRSFVLPLRSDQSKGFSSSLPLSFFCFYSIYYFVFDTLA